MADVLAVVRPTLRAVVGVDGLRPFHVAIVAHTLVDFGCVVVIVGIVVLPTHSLCVKVVSAVHGQVHWDACCCKLLGVGAEVDLRYATVAVGQHLVPHLVCAATRNRWQLKHNLEASHGFHFVALQVAPVVVPCVVIDEVHVGVLLHVLEVVVLPDGVGDIDMLVALVACLLEAYVVVHGFREETHAVEADALLLQVIAHLVVVGDGCIDGIDAAVAHVGQDCQRRLRFNEASHFVGGTANLFSCSVAVIVDDGEAVDVNAIACR